MRAARNGVWRDGMSHNFMPSNGLINKPLVMHWFRSYPGLSPRLL